MNEAIKIEPYEAALGYFIHGFWEEVTYQKIGPLLETYPDEWNDQLPDHKPVAKFIHQIFRINTYANLAMYKVHTFYKVSAS